MNDNRHSDFEAIASTDRRGYLVVGVCAALVVAIVLLLAQVVSWQRFDRATSAPVAVARAPVAKTPAMPVVRVAPDERSAPLGGQAAVAAALGDEAAWITSDDYPVESIRAGEQGRVTVRWVIGLDGRASDCGVVETSGYPRLDAAACEAITRRAMYAPARARNGEVIATTKTRRVKWVLPTLP